MALTKKGINNLAANAKRASVGYCPFRANLAVAIQEAKLNGMSKAAMRKSLRTVLIQLVSDGTIDLKLAAELHSQAEGVAALRWLKTKEARSITLDPAKAEAFDREHGLRAAK